MLRDWLELIRVPNVFTAMADVAMGFFFVTPVAALDARAAVALGLLVAASSLLYSAGMALNDVCDCEEDCRDRPGRPLPSGRIAVVAARRFGLGLLMAGVAVAGLVSKLAADTGPIVVAIMLAALIFVYNTRLRRHLRGPLILALCRALNVILGMMATVGTIAAVPDGGASVAGAIGLYVVGISAMARGEGEKGHRGNMILGMGFMIVAVLLLGWLPNWRPILVPADRWWWIVGFMVLLVAWRCVRAVVDPSPTVVQSVVGQSLRSLVVLDAVIVAAVAGIVPGVAVLALLVPNVLLSRWFYST